MERRQTEAPHDPLDLARRVWAEREGATSAEYGLLIALIALAVISGASLLGPAISSHMFTAGHEIDSAMTSGLN
jgi:Flp pilus assembly pilin Flp